ncbi:MAG: CPBP family intramembrane metalloprotease [Planctomycetota bacterium]|nr:CPBP family intramembrane metalloprotease [Planctomycetota bacterium]
MDPDQDEAEKRPEAEVVAKRTPLPGPGILGAIGWLLVLFGAQLFVGAVAGVALLVYAQATGTQFANLQGGPLLLLIGTAGNLLLALLVVALLYGRKMAQILAIRDARPLHLLLVVLIAPPLSLLASEVNNWVAEFAPNVSFMMEVFAEFAKQPLWLLLVVGCLIPAVAEEIYFRGLLGRGLVARYGIVGGTLLTSFFFAVIHVDPVQASSALVLGVALQLTYLATKSLLVPILLHLLNNALAFTSSRLPEWIQVPGYTLGPDEGVTHTPLLLVVAAIAASVTLGFVFYNSRSQWVTSDGVRWSPGYVTAESPDKASGAELLVQRPRTGSVLLAFAAYAVFVGGLVWVVFN